MCYCRDLIQLVRVTEIDYATIEHINTQVEHPDVSLDYNNLVVCCNRSYCCNLGRGEQHIPVFYYLVQASETTSTSANPFFKAELDGTISATLSDAVSFINGYQLNNDFLVNERITYLEEVIQELFIQNICKTKEEVVAFLWQRSQQLRFDEYCLLWLYTWLSA